MSPFTKNAILEAFTELLKHKSFSKITIQDITDRCGIARMTFYYHFSDIYEMIEWAIEEKMKKAVDSNFTSETWQQGYLAVFEAIRKERTFFQNVFPSLDLRKIETYLNHIAHRFVQSVVDEKKKKIGISISESSENLICDIYSYAMVGFFLQWISGGMKEEPRLVVTHFCTMLGGTLEPMLLRAAVCGE